MDKNWISARILKEIPKTSNIINITRIFNAIGHIGLWLRDLNMEEIIITHKQDKPH